MLFFKEIPLPKQFVTIFTCNSQHFFYIVEFWALLFCHNLYEGKDK